MKKITMTLQALVVLLAGALLGTACLGSLQQTFRDQDVVAMKKLGGLWSVEKFGDVEENDLPERPWVFSRGQAGDKEWQVDVTDHNARNATLEAVFFKVGRDLYVETSVLKNPRNSLAHMHELALRIPSRVELSGGRMKVFPLSLTKVEELAAKELGLRDIRGFTVLDANAAAWRTMLVKHGAKLFDDKPLIVLRRGVIKN